MLSNTEFEKKLNSLNKFNLLKGFLSNAFLVPTSQSKQLCFWQECSFVVKNHWAEWEGGWFS